MKSGENVAADGKRRMQRAVRALRKTTPRSRKARMAAHIARRLAAYMRGCAYAARRALHNARMSRRIASGKHHGVRARRVQQSALAATTSKNRRQPISEKSIGVRKSANINNESGGKRQS